MDWWKRKTFLEWRWKKSFSMNVWILLRDYCRVYKRLYLKKNRQVHSFPFPILKSILPLHHKKNDNTSWSHVLKVNFLTVRVTCWIGGQNNVNINGSFKPGRSVIETLCNWCRSTTRGYKCRAVLYCILVMWQIVHKCLIDIQCDGRSWKTFAGVDNYSPSILSIRRNV